MTDELSIMKAIKNYITTLYVQYKDEADTTSFQEKEIILDSPDFEQMTSNCNIWLEPNAVTCDDMTVMEDQASFNLKLCIVVKKGKSADLQEKIFHIKNAIYRLLKDNQDLGGLTDLISITGYNYYPQLYDELGLVGMDMDINIIYTLCF